MVARSIVRGSAASFAHFSGMAGAPSLGDDAKAATFEALGRDYDMAHHAEAGSSHASALSDEFLDGFAVAGSSEYCASRLAELAELGLDRIVLVPGSRDADPTELLASVGRLGAEVLPQLR